MGQENSKPEDGGIDMGPGGPSRVRPHSAGPEPAETPPDLPTKAPLKKTPSNNGKQWMRPSQARAAAAVEVRRQKASPGRLRPRPGTAPVNNGSLEAAMSQLLKTEDSLEQTREVKLEKNKKEFVGKINTFIKSTSLPRDVSTLPSNTFPTVPTCTQPIPEKQKTSWMSKLSKSKQAILDKLKDGLDKYYQPMSPDQVGDKVEKSLGSQLDQFAGYQGVVTDLVNKGVQDDVLDNFFFDEESERQLTTYEKWQVIKHAAEQVLQVYANRSNARWMESESWAAPTVVDSNAVSASVYANAVDSNITQGNIALMFIDDGRLIEANKEGELSSLVSTDLWQPIKEVVPHKVPPGRRLERLSVQGRHLLHTAVSVEMWYGAAALRNLKVIVAIDSEQEHQLVKEVQQWSYFGLSPNNLIIMPLPRFHGFAQDSMSGRLAHVKNSAKMMLGTGYAMFLLNSAAEAYTLQNGEPHCLAGSALDWMRDQHVTWLYVGLFSDVERLRPEAMFDVDFLAAAMYCADRAGCNMSMEVVMGEHERDVRIYDSIVLGRSGESQGNCNLRASGMRTVRSYQMLQQQVTNPHGFYMSTHRYAFKVSNLPRLLADATAFHADVKLNGFYAYATFDIGDITTFKAANCACVLGQGLRGPPMNEVVYGRNWLSYAAGILEMQDKVNEFRQKAIDLVQPDPAGTPLASESSGLRPRSAFKERREGLTVVLLLSPDNARMGKNALRLARLFVTNIVDRLHVVMITSALDNKAQCQAALQEVSDKELEFNGQLTREFLMRSETTKVTDIIKEYVDSVKAGLLVVPSLKLCGPTQDLGNTMSSLAYAVAKQVVDVPVLVVKANSAGKFHMGPQQQPGNERAPTPPAGGRDRLTVMCHLDSSQVSSMVDFVTRHMLAGVDLLYLARTMAFERPGQLSMRSRRVFVQARMSVANSIKVEERAYAMAPTLELPKACEAEAVDLLVVSISGELPISKDVDELLRSAKTSLYIYRSKEVAAPSQAISNNFVITEPAEQPRPYYTAGSRPMSAR